MPVRVSDTPTKKYRNVYKTRYRSWQAMVTRSEKRFCLGNFPSPDAAYIAVLEFEKTRPIEDRSVWCQRVGGYGKSKYKGVHASNIKKKPWAAMVIYRKKKYRLGNFATEEEAARAYDKKCLELRGPEARLNFPVKT